MALLHVDFFSKSLYRMVNIYVFLPVDGENEKELPEPPYKTLYLLSGAAGNYADWIKYSRICSYANEKKIAIVSVGSDNTSYLDHEQEYAYYGRFVGQEVVEMTRKMFPLSHKREDTFIGGLSMGGFGALRNGMLNYKTFGKIIDLSAGFYIEKAPYFTDEGEKMFFNTRHYAKYSYGENLEQAVQSDKNPRYLVERFSGEKSEFPKVFVACGLEDKVRIDDNKEFAQFMIERGIDVTTYWDHGVHNWDFWDMAIRRALDWMLSSDDGDDK